MFTSEKRLLSSNFGDDEHDANIHISYFGEIPNYHSMIPLQTDITSWQVCRYWISENSDAVFQNKASSKMIPCV